MKEFEALPLWVVVVIWLLNHQRETRYSSNYWKATQHRNMLENLANQVPYPGNDRVTRWLYRNLQEWIGREITILDTLIVAGLLCVVRTK
jgi:hypothetical protein